ncbi:MAG: HpcH/HpaI aldolase/citrate lyase family protein, partial [Thermomicrobiales bacterium]
ATTRASKALPMVRVPATQYHLISRPLDAGAMGIMVPMVESVEQARQIVQYAKYTPEGTRGAAFTISHDDFEGGYVPGKMQSANQEGFLIAQIETVAGLESCEAIAAVDGIDCLWVGHFDLSLSMGIAGQFDHPDFAAAITRVALACEARGKAAGVMAADIETAAFWKGLGYRAFAYNGDLWIYLKALSEGIAAVRAL